MKTKNLIIAIAFTCLSAVAFGQTGNADAKGCKDMVDKNYKEAKAEPKAGEASKEAREQARDYDKSRCDNKAERNSSEGLRGGCTYGGGCREAK